MTALCIYKSVRVGFDRKTHKSSHLGMNLSVSCLNGDFDIYMCYGKMFEVQAPSSTKRRENAK